MDISMIDVRIVEDRIQGPVLVLRCTTCPGGRVSYPIMRSELKLASLVRVAEMHVSERHRGSIPGPLCSVRYSRGQEQGSRCQQKAGHPGPHGKQAQAVASRAYAS